MVIARMSRSAKTHTSTYKDTHICMCPYMCNCNCKHKGKKQKTLSMQLVIARVFQVRKKKQKKKKKRGIREDAGNARRGRGAWQRRSCGALCGWGRRARGGGARAGRDDRRAGPAGCEFGPNLAEFVHIHVPSVPRLEERRHANPRSCTGHGRDRGDC